MVLQYLEIKRSIAMFVPRFLMSKIRLLMSNRKWAYDIPTGNLFLAESLARKLSEEYVVYLFDSLKVYPDQITLYVDGCPRVWFWASDAGCDMEIEFGEKNSSYWRSFTIDEIKYYLPIITNLIEKPMMYGFELRSWE